jgi:hypothetical protein
MILFATVDNSKKGIFKNFVIRELLNGKIYREKFLTP